MLLNMYQKVLKDFAKYKGDVKSIIYKLIGGLKSSMGYLGAKKVHNLKLNLIL